jgi:hypothetical protein
MKINRISAYTIDAENNLENKPTLDFTEYSKFKYGHKPTAMKFAESMMSEFLNKFSLEKISGESSEFIVSTSPYWYTPPSANSLAMYFHYMLNELLLSAKNQPLTFLKIHRSSAPVCDFSKLSHRERLENMKRDTLSFDPFLLKGKRLILVEDARITGAHEQKIIDFMEKAGLEEIIFIYVVDVGSGKNDPDIENRINHKWVNDLDTLQLLMKKPDEFVLNSRLCRFILSWENQEELEDFCKRLSDEMLFGLYISSVNDGYGSVEKYAKGFEVVRQESRIRHHQLIKTDNPGIPSFTL